VESKTFETPIVWGKGIKQQGYAWEDYLAKQMDARARLPKNFKTFDFFDRTTGTAISAKTLNTQTTARLVEPKQIYYSLKRNVDKAAGFKDWSLSGAEVFAKDIKVRKLEVAIPSGTGRPQLQQIQKAIKYGEQQGINMNITVVK
jgi:filamentous hemagglutinin